MENLIIKNIKKTFENKIILDNFNLEIETGKLTVLLGPSGCGKSTILKIIAGIHIQDCGTILLNGKDISNLPINKRNATMIFQEHLLFPHMSVFENIGFGLKMKKFNKKEITLKVNKLLELVKLNEHKNHYPTELSGGQKQRAVLARALAVEPQLLLLDEPFSSLDIKLRVEMRKLLRDIQQKTKVTMLMVTHDRDEAFFLADTVAIMFKKNIEQIDTPKNIYLIPATKKVANFFGKVSYIDGNIKGNYFFGGGFKIQIDKQDPLLFANIKNFNDKEFNTSLLLRPENISCASFGQKYKIITKEFYGDRIFYEIQPIECKSTNLFMLTEPTNDFSTGDTITINIKPHRYVFF